MLRQGIRGNDGQGGEETWFNNLVRKFLPQDAPQILRMTSEWPRVMRFAEEFSQRYFPLNTDYLEMVESWHGEMLAEDEEPEESPTGSSGPGFPTASTATPTRISTRFTRTSPPSPACRC